MRTGCPVNRANKINAALPRIVTLIAPVPVLKIAPGNKPNTSPQG
jgi:hypothetical protein